MVSHSGNPIVLRVQFPSQLICELRSEWLVTLNGSPFTRKVHVEFRNYYV
jgi:hypothetical protein